MQTSLSPEVPPPPGSVHSNGSPNNLSMVADSTSPSDGDSPNAPSSATSNQGQAPVVAVPAACLACSECVYVASRRGYKGPRRNTAANPNKRARSSSPTSTVNGADSCPMLLGANGTSAAMQNSMATFNPGVGLPDTPNTNFTATPNLTNLQLYRSFGAAIGFNSNHLALGQPQNGVPAQVPVPTLAERCLDSYYAHFHACHPFVLPKEWLLRIMRDTNVEPLLAAIRWIGSLYLEVGPARAGFLDEALRLVQDPTTSRDGFLVQALILLIVGLDGDCDQEKARNLLGEAERVALELGLNTREYAAQFGRGIPVLEESWRRTWWDLFVVDGMVAGVHRQTNFLLYDVPADAALPCEEHQYLSGNIPPPMSLVDLEDKDFSGEDREFSSFAYRILAGRNLGKFMRVPPIFGPDDENLARIEALLTNWRLHLPSSKKDALDQKLQSDEMIFQANMMNNAITIMLHQPWSQLDSSPTRSVTSCAPHRPVPSGDLFNSHTNHTIIAAAEISKMITHRVPLLSHTHFFTCVVTLSSIVHLSKWALFFIPHDDDELRQQIRLNIGALNKLSSVWKAAGRASGQVKGVAQEIYRTKKASQINPTYWQGFTQEEVMHSIAADETIMHDIEEGLGSIPLPNLDNLES
ncbi:hypothetical protein CkaCkLH20_06850 [Colletotrichum karsti]|uniref:Xylanolytic transcriptional activator regulatory domain-containing protein n=1 Tax=Colletotrichum karsti TaxID=1095194 RepID=A0A9P6I3Q1_9PEZI|nr:uncharacterized protein CkaCkLH20_06850 [Colletotrichum karsti]KAF9875469.1 hypothetical protein CkaCkLH20_06850 [Colletotrichum karsti]